MALLQSGHEGSRHIPSGFDVVLCIGLEHGKCTITLEVGVVDRRSRECLWPLDGDIWTDICNLFRKSTFA